MKPIITTVPFDQFCLELDQYVSPIVNEKVHIDIDTLYVQDETFFLKEIRVLNVKNLLDSFKFEVSIDISDLLILNFPNKILYIKPYSLNVYKTLVPKSFIWKKGEEE